MQTATADPLVGRRLEGRYRIVERIARGGMSTVYAAVDERLDRRVAVKVMNANLSSDPAFSDRFAREARAAARLAHVNVVSVYDQGFDDGPDGHHVFLVMELVEGRTLRELLHERGRLTPAEAVSIMEPVLSALTVAHHAGLVHRDVKPENILLSDHGVVKVADFGLARATETDASSTRTGLMMGTVAYCSPEQLSDGNCDPRSDVYSAGIVMFELLTGTPPYRGESAMNVAWQHVHSRVPAPSSRVRGIPSELDEIVVAATDSDPRGRPSDAADLLAEVADARASLRLPVTAVPPRVRARRSAGDPRRPDDDRRPDGPRRAAPPDHATTALAAGPNGRGRYDTTISPYGRADDATQTISRARSMDARDAAPQPPVVIPPRRGQSHGRDGQGDGGRGRPYDRRAVRRRKRRNALIAVLVVVALGIGAFFGARAFIAWRFAHVPSVAGLSRSAATAQLRDAGYRVQVLPGPQYSDRVPRGDVIGTRPGSGSRLPTGHTVVITWSAGPQYYAVPTVAGMAPQAAKDSIERAGPLRVGRFVERYSTSVPADQVITTSPAAGARLRSGQTVSIIVSRGPPLVSVPDIVAGTPFDSAATALRAANLKVDERRAYSTDLPAGQVIATDPSSGQVREFSTVVVEVSKGPRMVTIPAIKTGLTSDAQAAAATLTALGLKPTIVSSYSGPGPDPFDNLVRSVSPGSGQRVPIGSSVTITTF